MDAKLQELAGRGVASPCNTVTTDDASSAAVDSVSDIPQVSIDRLQQTNLNLREAIIKYEAIVDYLERLWDIKVMLANYNTVNYEAIVDYLERL